MERAWLKALALVIGLLTLTSPNAHSQDAAKDWPSKPVRMIINFAPGGTTDNAMRPYTERLSKSLGQQFVIENRGGASGAVGAEAVAKSAPDGYTFLVTPSLTMVIVPHLRKVPYDPFKDFKPVSHFSYGTLVFAVHPSLPVKSIEELVTFGKQNPGKLVWGTAGIGTYGHIISEGFKAKVGIDILHVPYRGGGESLADFLAGVFHIHADPNTVPHIHTGKARLLAILDRGRRPDFPDVRLLHEIYPDLDYILWFGLLAPPGTPDAIIKKLSTEMNRLSNDAEVKDLLFKVGATANPGTPEEMAALMRKDFERYGELIRKNNIKAE